MVWERRTLASGMVWERRTLASGMVWERRTLASGMGRGNGVVACKLFQLGVQLVKFFEKLFFELL